jgi:hypothetical protein
VFSMFKLPPLRHVVLDGLLTCYGSPPWLIHYWIARGRDFNENGYALLFGLMSGGLIGTLIWCIWHLPSEVAKVRNTLTVLGVLTFLYFVASWTSKVNP